MRRYGLKPWDLPHLTGGELRRVTDDVKAYVKGVSDGS